MTRKDTSPPPAWVPPPRAQRADETKTLWVDSVNGSSLN
jgi:hypothetical protein